MDVFLPQPNQGYQMLQGQGPPPPLLPSGGEDDRMGLVPIAYAPIRSAREHCRVPHCLPASVVIAIVSASSCIASTRIPFRPIPHSILPHHVRLCPRIQSSVTPITFFHDLRDSPRSADEDSVLPSMRFNQQFNKHDHSASREHPVTRDYVRSIQFKHSRANRRSIHP